MNTRFWKDKKVLLTGHTGFKGSWLSIWLQKLGVDLVGFSKSVPTEPSLFKLANVENGMISVMGDVCNLDHLKNIVKQYEPEIIIHMAAQSLVHLSYENPIETYATNVMGTVHLLDTVRKMGKSCIVINVTSDKCYENREWLWGYRENDPMGGYDPYSSSKGCAELVTSSFRNSFFNESKHEENKILLASVRAGNVIGGGDWASDRLIPDIMRGIMDKQVIKIRNPHAIRPWQHVLDPLNGYLQLAEKLWNEGQEYAEGWNFGPNDENIKPVSWIVTKLTQLWEGEIIWEINNENYLHEASYLKLDCTKAKMKLDWFTKINLELALKWTIEWYKQYLQESDMRKSTERQIDNFTLL